MYSVAAAAVVVLLNIILLLKKETKDAMVLVVVLLLVLCVAVCGLCSAFIPLLVLHLVQLSRQSVVLWLENSSSAPAHSPYVHSLSLSVV